MLFGKKTNIKNAIKLKSLYSRLILSYTFISVFIILSLAALLYQNFQKTSLQAIKINTMESLGKSINQLDMMQDRIFSLGQQLLKNESSVFNALYGNEELSQIEEALIIRKFYNIIDSDTIIDSIYLYNAATKEDISTFGVENRDAMNLAMHNLLKKHDIYGGIQYIPGRVEYTDAKGEKRENRIVSVVLTQSEYYPDYGLETAAPEKGYDVSAIIINLKEDAISSTVAALDRSVISDILLVDKKSDVLYDNALNRFGRNISGDKTITDIRTSGRTDGMFTDSVKGEKCLIVYKTMARNNWILINIYRYKDLFHDLIQLRIFVVSICMAILLCTILLSIFSARTIYSPLNALIVKTKKMQDSDSADADMKNEGITEIQYLENAFTAMKNQTIRLENSAKENLSVIKEALLIKAMKGLDFFEDTLKQNFNRLFQNILLEESELGCYVIVVFCLDKYNKTQNIQSELMEGGGMISSFKTAFSIEIARFYPCEPVESRDKMMTYLIKITGQERLTGTAIQKLQTIHNNLQKELDCQISCSVGMSVNKIEDLYQSYSNAMELLKYRLVYGYGLFYYNELHKTTSIDAIVSVEKEKEHLMQMINLCNKEEAEAAVKEIIANISSCQYDYIMLIINQIILEIVKTAQKFTGENKEEFNFNNLYSNLNRIDTLEDIQSFLILYCKAVIGKIEEKRKNSRKEMIEEAIEFMKLHYYEYEISAERLAEKAGITSGYFGKLFNEHTGKSVNEYIVQLRLDSAKEMLLHTDMIINDIAAEVGFNNATYFMTVFKKNTGMTPNQYRRNEIQS